MVGIRLAGKLCQSLRDSLAASPDAQEIVYDHGCAKRENCRHAFEDERNCSSESGVRD